MELEDVKVSATVIVISRDNKDIRNSKVLIVQRPPDKTFPNLWTVAGGKLQDTDGRIMSEGFMYFSVEACAVRELCEETGIPVSIKDLKYLCSITTIWGKTRRVILSYYVVTDKSPKDVKVSLNECLTYRWITKDEIKDFDFIPDIGGEIKEVFDRMAEEKYKKDGYDALTEEGY